MQLSRETKKDKEKRKEKRETRFQHLRVENVFYNTDCLCNINRLSFVGCMIAFEWPQMETYIEMQLSNGMGKTKQKQMISNSLNVSGLEERVFSVGVVTQEK